MKDNQTKKLDRLVRQYHIGRDDCHLAIDVLKQHVASHNDTDLANGVEVVGERFDELNDTIEAIVATAQEACKPTGSGANSPKWTPLQDNLRKYEQDEIMDTLFEDIDVDEIIYYVEYSFRPADCLIVCRDKAGDWYCRSIKLEDGYGLDCAYDDCGLTKFSAVGRYGLMKLHYWVSNSMMATHLKTEGYLAEYLK